MVAVGKLRDFVDCALTLGDTPSEKWRIFWRETKNFRVRLGLARYHPDATYSLNTRFGRLYFRDNFGDITNLTNLLYRRVYRWTELRHPGVILDVGANIGLASVWFSHHNPGRKIVACEPLPENVVMIRQNVPTAEIINAAIGDQVGQVTLTTDQDGIMASRVPNATHSTHRTFPLTTLDTITAENKINQAGLLKIDAEGMEVEILQGGSRTIQQTGQVVIETHGKDRHDHCMEILRMAGFSIEDHFHGNSTGMIFATRQ
jgi:FkbM family methyltransferase